MIQNLLAELDAPEEFYFNKSSRVLYFFPNRTVANGTAPQPPTAEELGGQLGVVRLQNLLRIEGAGAGPTHLQAATAAFAAVFFPRHVALSAMAARQSRMAVSSHRYELHSAPAALPFRSISRSPR